MQLVPRLHKRSVFLALVGVCSFAAGCSSAEKDEGEPTSEAPPDEDDCADLNTPGSRCVAANRFDFEPSDNTLDADLAEMGVEFAPPDDGFQIETQGVRLDPGEDDEWCEAFVVPEDPDEPGRQYCVNRFEVGMALGFHHIFVAKAPPGSNSEALMEVGERVRCVGGAHVAYGTDLEPIPLPQARYVDVPLWKGVGVRVKAGQKLSVNYHWLNATDTTQIAVTKLNFHAASCEGMSEMRQFGFYDQDISIPPHGTYATEMSGTFTQDIYVLDIFRHTHRFGGDVPISFYKGDRDGELIYLSPDYDSGASFQFPEPVLFKKGEGIKFTCNYTNPTAQPIRFGPTANDEMCMLLGTYWLVDQTQTPEIQHRYKF